jgi:hypothetical protein
VQEYYHNAQLLDTKKKKKHINLTDLLSNGKKSHVLSRIIICKAGARLELR